MASSERWLPRGLLLAAPPPLPDAVSHAALPSAFHDGEAWQLYFSTRDADGRSSIARVGLDVGDGSLAVRDDFAYVLRPGRLGTFDDSGVTHSCVVAHRDRVHLYYTGWTRTVTVPFQLFAGCAVSADGGRSFERVHEAPVMERSAVDPFMTASPWVLVEDGRWRAWYVSCTGWDETPAGPRHRYHLKEASSDDGLAWRRDGSVAVDYASADEYALGRPCVVRAGEGYRMWLCARGAAYALHVAASPDGSAWTRAPLALERSAWDAEMQAYPALLDADGQRFLLWNGNGYGATGIGYAVASR